MYGFRRHLRVAVLCLASAVAMPAAVVLPASEAQATTYHVQTRTAFRATQHLRSDTTWATPRILSQSLTLSAFDLRGNDEGDVNARLSLRYRTDLGLEQRLRQDPLFDARWNDGSLDVAYVEWRPFEALRLTAGRQWYRSPLGITDIDGLAVAWRDNSTGLRPFASVAAGRDVQRGLTPWDPGAFDVQGLPPNESVITDDPWHFMTAASAGLVDDGRNRVEFAAQQHRRPSSAPQNGTATTRRFGATATTSPADRLTLTTTASFHSLIDHIDRTRLDAAYRVGGGVAGAGVDHRRPIFDSSSIFNLFGAQPSRSAYVTYRRPIEAISTTVELRSWTRLYFDESASVLGLGDEQALGAALANFHRFELLVPLDIYWQVSAQTLTGVRGGDQYLGTARLRGPGPVDGLFLTGRVLGMWAAPGHPRRQSGYATTAGLGAEVEVGEVGSLSVNMESRFGTYTPANTAVFALFELETSR